MQTAAFLLSGFLAVGGAIAVPASGRTSTYSATGDERERRSGAACLDLAGELLERFRPALYFVESGGPDAERIDYPCSYAADDAEIENNFARLVGSGPSLCYGRVHQQSDANGKTCWVVEYDYYYPRNWSELPPPAGCFTHEHDWEWIYIVVGIDGTDYRPYCACFSGHTAGNPDLFDLDGKVRLFPGVAGGSVWSAAWDRHPEWAPRVSLGWDEHVEATALATGNAFDGSPTQPRSPHYWSFYEVRGTDLMSTTCTPSNRFCFGDPDLSLLCIGRSGRGECDDPVAPPWIREGLGANDPLPSDFALPEDWEENSSTEIPVRPSVSRVVRIAPNPCRGRLEVAFPLSTPPDRLELLDVSGRVVRRLPWETPLADGSSRSFDLRDLLSGLYLLRARWPGDEEEVLRVVLLP